MTQTPAGPQPSVPYGPGQVERAADPATLSAPVTSETVAKGVGSSALKWGVRVAIVLIVKTLFRALAKR